MLIDPKDMTVVCRWKSSNVKNVSFAQEVPDSVHPTMFLDLDDKWVEHFAHSEAFLARRNIISTPDSPAKKPPVADKPFLEPNSALVEGSVMLMAAPKDQNQGRSLDIRKTNMRRRKILDVLKQNWIQVPIAV